MLNSINPSNGNQIASYLEMDFDVTSSIVDKAHEQFINWRKTSFEFRASKIRSTAAILRKRKEEFAKLMTLEMGKPIVQARAEVEKCAWVCDYYADNAEKFLTDEIVETDAQKSFISFQPIGVVLAVMPWNFPFWQVFRFASPTLMAGNAAILKHASNVSGCALAIEKIFEEAGFPSGLFRTILVSSKNIEPIIKHPLIKAVTLTGSVTAGKSIASLAGSLIKKTVLELGGSDPYLILEDADIESAAECCVTARLLNGGQSCIAAKRFIIVESVYDDFEKIFLEKMKSKKMGDPFDESNSIGPQASLQLRDELHQQVLKSIELGAKLLLGGEIPEINGAYYPPTVLANVRKGMPAFEEELFGPVAALIKVADEEEAIRTANDSNFGLGAALFTSDKTRGEIIAKEKFNAGCCFVNEFVRSDPRLPFGGINESGYGRELSTFGIREFVNIKTVFIK
ncbi:MAG: NAD-dependent succinate-semialdehyde dehydrogenase [Ignavibacteriales bacterium]|nr:NAD-dependent succinate-semialdehyde dehydrogenase [Ignavibacteriales bacterium]